VNDQPVKKPKVKESKLKEELNLKLKLMRTVPQVKQKRLDKNANSQDKSSDADLSQKENPNSSGQ